MTGHPRHEALRMVTVGVSHGPNATQVGQEAAWMALSQLGDEATATCALVFCGGRLQPSELLYGLRSRLGGVPIVGGAAAGVITGGHAGCSGYECAVATFPDSLPRPESLVTRGLSGSELQAGADLGAQVAEVAQDGAAVLIFYDLASQGLPARIPAGSLLLRGVYEGLGDRKVTLFGAGLVGACRWDTGFMFDGCEAARDVAVAVVLPACLQAHSRVLQVCLPASAPMEITGAAGDVIQELDGRPAGEVIERLLGLAGDHSPDLLPELIVGANLGDPWAPTETSDFVCRPVETTDRATGSVRIAEGDLEVGARVHLMIHDGAALSAAIHRAVAALQAETAGVEPVLALYTDSCERTGGMNSGTCEEVSAVRSALHPWVPLLGFHSGTQIGALAGRARVLHRAGVLTILTQECERS